MLNLLFISNEDTRRVAFQTEEYAINIVIVITSNHISRASTKIENALTQNSLISKNELALPETSKEKEKKSPQHIANKIRARHKQYKNSYKTK